LDLLGTVQNKNKIVLKFFYIFLRFFEIFLFRQAANFQTPVCGAIAKIRNLIFRSNRSLKLPLSQTKKKPLLFWVCDAGERRAQHAF
jgi:hypothetical protein